MEVVIDLVGLTATEQVLHKFGDVFEFGGPNGNHPVRPDERRGWGMCWDALEDCLRELNTQGIWGTSKRYSFPLTIIIKNYECFEQADPASFSTLKNVLENRVLGAEEEEQMTVTFA